MQRKTAIAAALAITMSLSSGVVALSANAGALGFGSSAPVAATQSVVAPVAGGVRAATATAVFREGERDDGARLVQIGTDHSATTKGEHSG